MAQKILLRRGSIGNIGSTIAVSKGELLYATGSISGVENVVFIANADGNNTFTPVNKLYTGTAAANSFNAALNGTPYYKSDSQALFILNSAGSTALDLSGNLEGTQISSITASGSFSGSFVGNGSGLTNISLGSLSAPGNNTEVLYNNGGTIAATSNLTVTATSLNAAALNIVTTGNISGSNLKLTGNADISGNVVIGGNITIGDAGTDFINFAGEISSSLIPDGNDEFDLGSPSRHWRTVYADSVSGSTATSTVNVGTVTAVSISGSNLHVEGSATVENTLNAADVRATNVYIDSGVGSLKIGPTGTETVIIDSNSGNTKIAGTLIVTGSATLASTLRVATGISSSGWIHAAGALDVDGAAVITGNTSLGGTLAVTGATTLTTVSASSYVSASDTIIRGWGSVSASLASIQAGTSALTLQNVTDTGNSTTTNIVLNNNGNQTITHTGTSGNLTISSDSGSVYVEGTLFSGNNVTIPSNLTVQGTTTTIDSTTVNIGDSIIVLNAAGAAVDGGIQVVDAVSTGGTGSLLWNATSDYWYAGVSGSTHYRLATYDSATPTANSIQKVDNNGRLTTSIISDNGSIVTVAGTVSGSILNASTGITAVGLQGVIDTSSRVIFRDGSNRLGALATTDSAVEVTTVLGYKADGTLVATSVIDGGTF